MVQQFFADARLLGIMAQLKQYQLCWHLNRMLNFDFRINNQMEIGMVKKGRQYFFPIYQFQKPSESLCHFIYSNQDDGEYLLPELRHFDFIWLMKFDGVPEEDMSLFINSAKAIPATQMVVELAPEKVKNKQSLVF